MRSLLLFPMLAGTILGQTQPEALDMLRRSASALQEFRTGEIDTENTGIYQRTSKPLTIKASLLWSMPDKVRLVIGSETAGETSVSDGHILATYSKLSHEYVKREGVLPIPVAQGRAYRLPGFADNPHLTSARIVRDEKVSVGSTIFNCAFIEAEVDGGQVANWRRYSLWIDKETGITLRLEGVAVRDQAGKKTEFANSFVVRRLVLNQPVDESVFAFDPPSGAKSSDGSAH